MRKGDLELLEMRLDPHSKAIDRLTADVGDSLRALSDLRDRVKDLERAEQTHSTEIAQGLASIRSLLQRANRAAREQGIIEDDPPIDADEEEVQTVMTRDDATRAARLKLQGRTVL